MWVAIGVAVVLRLVWIVIALSQRGIEAFLVPDSWAYIEFAMVFALRGEFANMPGTPRRFSERRDTPCCCRRGTDW